MQIFLIVSVISALAAFFVIRVARRFGVIDEPLGERKIHSTGTPLLGGLAVFSSFWVVAYFVSDRLLAGRLEPHHWIGVFVGSCFLVVGGILDDKYNLKPLEQFVFPVLAIVSVLIGGVEIEKITNPFGGYLFLSDFKVVSSIIIALWLLGMMYTTKLLDGVDGLVSGVTGIGAFIIFLFTLTTKYFQPDIGLAALILAGACAGFLILNWHPAKIFLGEGGSLLLGFLLGVLAIISGGKIAIALLVMGLPIMDVAWTIIRRLAGGKNPFKFADKKHLHHRLLELGLGPRKTVLIFYAFSLFFGLSALFLQSRGKLYALVLLLLVMMGLVVGFSYLDKNKSPI